jgi:hypothetical protein
VPTQLPPGFQIVKSDISTQVELPDEEFARTATFIAKNESAGGVADPTPIVDRTIGDLGKSLAHRRAGFKGTGKKIKTRARSEFQALRSQLLKGDRSVWERFKQLTPTVGHGFTPQDPIIQGILKEKKIDEVDFFSGKVKLSQAEHDELLKEAVKKREASIVKKIPNFHELPEEIRVRVRDLDFNAKGGIGTFTSVVDSLKANDLPGAAKNMARQKNLIRQTGSRAKERVQEFERQAALQQLSQETQREQAIQDLQAPVAPAPIAPPQPQQQQLFNIPEELERIDQELAPQPLTLAQAEPPPGFEVVSDALPQAPGALPPGFQMIEEAPQPTPADSPNLPAEDQQKAVRDFATAFANKAAQDEEFKKTAMEGVDTRVKQEVRQGLRRGILSQGADAAFKAATGESLLEGEVKDGPIALLTELAVDAPVFGRFFKAFQFAVPRMFQSLKFLKSTKQLENLAKLSKRGTDMGLETAKARALSDAHRLVRRRVLEGFTKGSLTVGAGEGSREVARQAREQEFDPARIVREFGTGALVGGTFGAIVKKVGGRALTKPLQRRLSPKAGEKLLQEQRFVDQTIQRAQSEARIAVSQGKIRPEDQHVVASRIALEELNAKGFKIYESGTPLLDDFLTTTTKFNKIDKVAKTQLSEVGHNLIVGEAVKANMRDKMLSSFAKPMTAIRKMGFSNDDITELMRYVVTDRRTGQIRFDPTARVSGAAPRVAWQGPMPSAQLQQELFKIRQTFDDVFLKNPEFAERAGFVEGYIPLIQRRTPAAIGKPGTTVRNIQDPRFLKARGPGFFNPAEHVTDFGELAKAYSNMASQHVAFSKTLPKLYREVIKLQLLGRAKEAEEVLKVAQRSMGIRDSKKFSEIFAGEIFDANRQLIQQLSAESGLGEKLGQEVLNVIRNQTFNNLVFANPRTILKQFLQPRLVGSAEIGGRWVGRGSSLWRSKAGRKLADEMMPLMRIMDANALRELGPDAVSGRLKNLDQAMSTVSAPGKFTFNRFDIRNRGISFLGSHAQFQDAVRKGTVNQALDGMLSGEQAMVLQTLEREGAEAAARLYGIIRSRRINFAYGIADRPNLFAEGKLARLIPFTTWSGNMFNRLMGDVAERNVKAAAKRVAIPMVQLALFRAATGYDIPGAHPLAAIPGIFGLQALPAVGSTAEAFAVQGPQAGALEALKFTPAGPVRRVVKGIQEKQDAGELARLEKDRERDPFMRLLPEFMRSSVTGRSDFGKGLENFGRRAIGLKKKR